MAVDDPLEVLAERQAARNGTSAITDTADARIRLEALLGLEQPGIRIQAVHLFGSGTETTLRIDLSTGDDLRFEPADSMVRPQTVSARVALAVGVAIHPKQPQCIEALSLARQLAEMVAAYTEIDQARDWGSEYLQAASTCEFDSRNQAHRFAAFKMLAGRDPHTHSRGETCTLAQAGIVLRDTDGGRLVRSSWFLEHVRSNAPRVSHKHLPTLMHEAGWARPKRIKATSPGSGEQLIWAFYTVPTGWDDDPLNRVTPMADTAPIPRLALTREEAAAAIGMSLDSFERHVQPTLRLVRLGRLRLIPISELECWLEQNAQHTLK